LIVDQPLHRHRRPIKRRADFARRLVDPRIR